ncbi:hypothetical protein POM88_051420 [Heracleum sosnowskyi]|uniref:MULE transposase domain-containing protein n=1 Tax=Heracleum sosnowskyi TaxID=360622 RepID=A0AAD8H0E8_9APIA|nr:hypothetical protein POM88_051420 [Heracleum sosnowskyi]
MTWLIRDVDHGGGGSFGAETPDYGGNSDLFTIKLHIGGHFSSKPKAYIDDVGIFNSGAWTFISDRQKGLINALENVVPNAEHRFCVMHLYNNMVKDHKGRGVRDLLWKAARASNEYMFNKHMTAL